MGLFTIDVDTEKLPTSNHIYENQGKDPKIYDIEERVM
jgi:hypothetical protein